MQINRTRSVRVYWITTDLKLGVFKCFVRFAGNPKYVRWHTESQVEFLTRQEEYNTCDPKKIVHREKSQVRKGFFVIKMIDWRKPRNRMNCWKYGPSSSHRFVSSNQPFLLRRILLRIRNQSTHSWTAEKESRSTKSPEDLDNSRETFITQRAFTTGRRQLHHFFRARRADAFVQNFRMLQRHLGRSLATS